jgi:hypothetical protein
MTESWELPGEDYEWLTPKELEAIKKRTLARLQSEHEASVRKQRMRMKPMDRSNVVPKK